MALPLKQYKENVSAKIILLNRLGVAAKGCISIQVITVSKLGLLTGCLGSSHGCLQCLYENSEVNAFENGKMSL
jgi:hypothetical protein